MSPTSKYENVGQAIYGDETPSAGRLGILVMRSRRSPFLCSNVPESTGKAPMEQFTVREEACEEMIACRGPKIAATRKRCHT